MTSSRSTRTSRRGALVTSSSASVVSPRSTSIARSARDLAPFTPKAFASTPLASSHSRSDATSRDVPVQPPGLDASPAAAGDAPALVCMVRLRVGLDTRGLKCGLDGVDVEAVGAERADEYRG